MKFTLIVRLCKLMKVLLGRKKAPAFSTGLLKMVHHDLTRLLMTRLSFVKLNFVKSGCHIAVHCIAGFGKAQLLAVVALTEARMKYKNTVNFIRQK